MSKSVAPTFDRGIVIEGRWIVWTLSAEDARELSYKIDGPGSPWKQDAMRLFELADEIEGVDV